MKKLLLLLLFLATLGSQAHAIDLSVRWVETFIDGVPFRRPYFTVDEKKYTLSINRETVLADEMGGVVFRFSKFPAINSMFLNSRLTPGDEFSGPTLERYRESAKRLLPLRSREVEIREERANPLPVNNWQSYRIVITCMQETQVYRQEVTFLNLNDHDQVVIVAGAPEAQFAEATHRTFQIIRTWQELLPGDERAPTSN